MAPFGTHCPLHPAVAYSRFEIDQRTGGARLGRTQQRPNK